MLRRQVGIERNGACVGGGCTSGDSDDVLPLLASSASSESRGSSNNKYGLTNKAFAKTNLRFLRFLTAVLVLGLANYGFNPYTNGFMYWYCRLHSVPIVEPPYDDLPPERTCALTILNQRGKQRYRMELERTKKWAESRGFSYHEYMQEDHLERFNVSVNIMFLKYHGIEYLFRQKNCDYVLYLDGDATVIPGHGEQPLPLPPGKDVVFGNEIFRYAMHRFEDRATREGALNAGFLLLRKTDFTHQFLKDVLSHPRCDGCRHRKCVSNFPLTGFDQPCIEKLLSNEYKDDMHRFGIARIQGPLPRGQNLMAYTFGNLLLCHPAGEVKLFYNDPCEVHG